MKITRDNWIGISLGTACWYNPLSFWNKYEKAITKITRKTAKQLLILYYSLQSDSVPKKIKAIIIGALGYFIFPLDLIPDMIPVAGYSDDALIVAFCLAYVRAIAPKEAYEKTDEKIDEWFS